MDEELEHIEARHANRDELALAVTDEGNVIRAFCPEKEVAFDQQAGKHFGAELDRGSSGLGVKADASSQSTTEATSVDSDIDVCTTFSGHDVAVSAGVPDLIAEPRSAPRTCRYQSRSDPDAYIVVDVKRPAPAAEFDEARSGGANHIDVSGLGDRAYRQGAPGGGSVVTVYRNARHLLFSVGVTGQFDDPEGQAVAVARLVLRRA